MDGNGRTGWGWIVELVESLVELKFFSLKSRWSQHVPTGPSIVSWKICTCEPWQSATSQHSSIGRASSSSNSTACWQSCASAGCNCCYTLRILEFKFLKVYGSRQLARGFRCIQMLPDEGITWITLKLIKTVIISLSSSLTARAHSNCWASASRSRAAGSFANWGATHKYQRHPAEMCGHHSESTDCNCFPPHLFRLAIPLESLNQYVSQLKSVESCWISSEIKLKRLRGTGCEGGITIRTVGPWKDERKNNTPSKLVPGQSAQRTKKVSDTCA